MNLEYENGVIRIQNARGLRWQIKDAVKPPLGFDYDALALNEQHALRRIGQNVEKLTDEQIARVHAFVDQLNPPPAVTLQKQTITDLRAFAHGLVNSVVAQLEYDGLMDVVITGREGSTDLYAEEARRVLTYIDAVWNAFHGLATQIAQTPTAELRTVKDYAETMPFPPPMDYFDSGLHPGLFDAQHRDR